MDSEMKDLERLLLSTGLTKERIESVLRLLPINHDCVLQLYMDAVKESCFLNRPEALKDLATYVHTRKCGRGMVNFAGLTVFLSINFPINIVVELAQELCCKGILSLLPSLLQAVIDVSDIGNVSVIGGMPMITLLNKWCKDEQLIADGHEALFQTTRIILNSGKVYDIPSGLHSLFESFNTWTIDDAPSVESIEQHFELVVRLVELFINHEVLAQSFLILNILCIAEKNIKVYTTRAAQNDMYLAKMNAIMDGLGDVFRCFLLVKSLGSTVTLHPYFDKVHCFHEYVMIKSAISTIIIGYSSPIGCSDKLIQLLLDSLSSEEVSDLKEMMISNIHDVPISTEIVLRSSSIEVPEDLNEFESPRRLQSLARRAIHGALKKKKLLRSTPVHHRGQVYIDLLTLGLPERMLDYCMYYQ